MLACTATTSARPAPTAAQLGEPSKDIDPELIGAAVRDNSRQFQLCYQAARERNPGLAGQLAVRFVINPDGTVGHAAIVESSLPADVSKCVVGAFSNLKLPKQESAVVAQYPMFFEPS
jgi:outer membrane biosynthesis protein TonB